MFPLQCSIQYYISGEGLLTEWVSDYVKQLRLTRERGMGGANGTQQVTSDILDAEVKLAEVS